MSRAKIIALRNQPAPETPDLSEDLAAIGASIASGDMSAAGTSNATAEGGAIAGGVGYAAGTSTAEAEGSTGGGVVYASGAGYAAGTSTAEAVGEDGQDRTIYGGKVHDIRAKRNRQIEAIIKGIAPEVMDYFKRAA